MKLGMIGLGQIGEGMSRLLIKAGHEVWGYREDYDKAEEQYEKGYISGCATSIESLVLAVSSSGPGIYMIADPSDAEENLTELLQHCEEGDIIINTTEEFKERELYLEKLGIQYINYSISGSVDGSNIAVSICTPLFKALSSSESI